MIHKSKCCGKFPELSHEAIKGSILYTLRCKNMEPNCEFDKASCVDRLISKWNEQNDPKKVPEGYEWVIAKGYWEFYSAQSMDQIIRFSNAMVERGLEPVFIAPGASEVLCRRVKDE